MTKAEDAIKQIRALSDEYERLTGEQGYVYTTVPTPSTLKVVFGDKVCLGYAEALAHISGKVAEARAQQ